MNNFSYHNPAKIIFGKNSELQILDELKNHNAKSVLLIYSGDFIKTLGIFDVVKNACNSLGIKFIENGNVVPNPKLELVHTLINQAKSADVDFIVAVGGGSAMDTAKAVAMGACYDGDVWDFFIGKANLEKALPIGVISTLPASGSETSNAAIISYGLHKKGYEDNLIIPKFAIMNPEFTINLPAYQTSCGIADIFSHLLERYLTNTEYVDTTDYLIEGACKALLVNAKRLISEPSDYNARAEIQWLATIAHNNLLDTGRESDWASHRIEHELSAQYGITHGEGMAVVLVGYLKYISKHNPNKSAQFANRVFGIDSYNYTSAEMTMLLSKELDLFFKELNLKTTLSEFDIDNTHFEDMANRATNNNTQKAGHYLPLDCKEFIEVLNLCI